jgi:hypothetical protein
MSRIKNGTSVTDNSTTSDFHLQAMLLSTNYDCLNVRLMQRSENEKRFLGCGHVESEVSDVRLQDRRVGAIVGCIYC